MNLVYFISYFILGFEAEVPFCRISHPTKIKIPILWKKKLIGFFKNVSYYEHFFGIFSVLNLKSSNIETGIFWDLTQK